MPNDLLGGQHGPLRPLTRAVRYSILFGIGYGVGLGLFFGFASGIATGIPSLPYASSVLGTVVRTVRYIATALVCSALVHRVEHAWSFAIRVGLVTGLVTASE